MESVNLHTMTCALLLLTLLGTGPAGREAVQADSQSVVLELHPQRDRYRGATELFVTLSESTRRIALESRGLEPSRIELVDGKGRVDLVWGERPAGTLLLEARRDIAAGPLCIRVAFDGAYPDSAPGLVRTGRGRRARLRSAFAFGGASAAFPCMTGVGPQSWTLTIEVPATHQLRTNLGRQRTGYAPGVRTSVFRSRRPIPADSLRIEEGPRLPRRGPSRLLQR
ncbi:MAG: hypothetical protein ABIU54_05765 [Candidatus Eisenbacteria bacterium]